MGHQECHSYLNPEKICKAIKRFSHFPRQSISDDDLSNKPLNMSITMNILMILVASLACTYSAVSSVSSRTMLLDKKGNALVQRLSASIHNVNVIANTSTTFCGPRSLSFK